MAFVLDSYQPFPMTNLFFVCFVNFVENIISLDSFGLVLLAEKLSIKDRKVMVVQGPIEA